MAIGRGTRGGFLSGGGSSGGGLDLTSGGTIGGDLTVNGHLTMGSGKQIRADDGTVGAPGIAFASDPDNGFYRTGADAWSSAIGGAQLASFAAALVSFKQHVELAASKQLRIDDGTVGAPGIAFRADTDNGFYRTGADAWSSAIGGAQLASFAAALLSFKQNVELAAGKQLLVDDGSAGAPGLAFRADTDNGLYRVGADSWGLAAAGALLAAVKSGSLEAAKRFSEQVVTQTITVAGDVIDSSKSYVRIAQNTGAGITLTSTPSISTTGAVDGQILVIECAGANAVTVQDVTGLAGSKCRLQGGTSKVVGLRDIMVMQYNATDDEWKQVTALAAL